MCGLRTHLLGAGGGWVLTVTTIGVVLTQLSEGVGGEVISGQEEVEFSCEECDHAAIWKTNL